MALNRIYVLPGENQDREPPIPQAQRLCKNQVNCFFGQTSSTALSKITDNINQNVINEYKSS